MKISRRLLALVLAVALMATSGLVGALAAPVFGVQRMTVGDSGTGKAALKKAITDTEATIAARGEMDVSEDGTDVYNTDYWMSPAQQTVLDKALADARSVDADQNATQQAANEATAALTTAAKALTQMGECGLEDLEDTQFLYENLMNYVSIDTKDTGAKSDYFVFSTWLDADGYRIAKAAPKELRDALELSIEYGREDKFRFMLAEGKTLRQGVYNVPIMVLRDGYWPKTAQNVNVELHVNATDPAYFTVTDAVFTIADLNNPAKEYVSAPLSIKVPSGDRVTALKAAENGYEVVNGAWNAAKREYAFQLKAKADAEGNYNFKDYTGVLATFESMGAKGRMAYVPADVGLLVKTTDVKLRDYINIGPIFDENNSISVGEQTNLSADVNWEALPENAFLYTMWEEITNFVSVPAGALVFEDGNQLIAKAKGSATFDATVEITELSGLFKVAAAKLEWFSTGFRVVTNDNPYEKKIRFRVKPYDTVIDINDLSTYTMELTASAYDKYGKPLELSEFKLEGRDAEYFTMGPVTKADTDYKFTLTLVNQAKELPRHSFSLTLSAQTTLGELWGGVFVSWKAFDGPDDIYFTKDGKKITEDTLLVGAAGAKYGVVVENYKLKPGEELKIETIGTAYDIISIVRGNVFYSDYTTNETITVRMDRALKTGETVRICGTATGVQEITNPEVLLTLSEYSNRTYTTSGTDLILHSASTPVVPDKPTGGSGGKSNGANSGFSAGITADRPSANVNADGSVNGGVAANEAAQAVKDALAKTNAPKVNIVVENAASLSPATARQIAEAAQKADGSATIYADTTYGGKTVARLVIDPAKAALLKTDIKLSVYTNEANIAATKSLFEKYFGNKFAVASFAQQGSFGMTLAAAVRVDLTGINLKTLRIYSYDKATNKYYAVSAEGAFVDANGFLHFNTDRGGDYIFTDSALKTK